MRSRSGAERADEFTTQESVFPECVLSLFFVFFCVN